jgi:hypothetical protein
MGGSDGMEGIVKVVQSLKKKRKALADQPLDD